MKNCNASLTGLERQAGWLRFVAMPFQALMIAQGWLDLIARGAGCSDDDFVAAAVAKVAANHFVKEIRIQTLVMEQLHAMLQNLSLTSDLAEFRLRLADLLLELVPRENAPLALNHMVGKIADRAQPQDRADHETKALAHFSDQIHRARPCMPSLYAQLRKS